MSRNEVKKLSSNVHLGDTETFTCPYCKAAWEKEGRPQYWKPTRSMSITRDRLGVLYHCFRATCNGSSGYIPDITLEHEPPPRTKFKAREYSFDLAPLAGNNLTYFLDKGFTHEEIQDNVRYNADRETYVFPIRDARGYTVGYVDRDYSGERDIKAISYWQSDVPRLHFVRPVSRGVERILVVEDVPSAIKGNRYMPACALLGSHISDAQARHLRELTDTVVLALDNDATTKAVKLKNRYGFYFGNFDVLVLSKDIKDMNNEELEELLGG